jgi:hypothetical protein
VANYIINKKKKTVIESTAPEVMEYWPSWKYHPTTGEGQIFQSEEEVPDGWVDTPADTKVGKAQGLEAGASGEDDNGEEPEELEPVDDLTVKVIKARLDAREVPYANNSSKDNLYQLLEDNWELEG